MARTVLNKEARDQFFEGDYAKVIDTLTLLEEIDLATEGDLRLLVYSFHALDRYEEALAIIHRHPENRLLDHPHVRILEETGRLEEAEIVRKKALDYALKQLERGDDHWLVKAHWLDEVGLLQANPKGEIEYYKKSLEEKPNDFVVNYNLACSLVDDGQLHEGLKYARIAADLQPDYVGALKLVKQLEQKLCVTPSCSEVSSKLQTEVESLKTDDRKCDIES